MRVPITGNRSQRILHGATNVRRGDTLLLITEDWDQLTHQAFVTMIRSHWRGWHIILCEDRASQHQAPASLAMAAHLGIEIRLLPRATPELNARDHLWRHAQRDALASRATQTVEQSAMAVCHYLLDRTPREHLRKAGIVSGNFWLTK